MLISTAITISEMVTKLLEAWNIEKFRVRIVICDNMVAGTVQITIVPFIPYSWL